ncbi:MAG: family 20 glycosylhydrolase [Segetibacter sp.]|nr:family 20 glycosylhydrolase [Segetibacter sp.]
MKRIPIMVFLLFSTSLFAQNSNIIPEPVSYQAKEGNFLLNKKTKIVLNDAGELNSANFFNDYLQKFYGFKLHIANNKSEAPASNFILLTTNRFAQPAENEAKYKLNVSPQSINIQGDSYQGTFYGIQTLLRLLPVQQQNQFTIPAVAIEDYPRFKYRGMHLDVGRHFFPVEFIKKYIDYIALYKMNTFHWHLTEDQGWRIEIKKYPKLTSVGAFRNGTIKGRHPGTGNDSTNYGGFYTQDQVKEVVKYAADRFITVIPEIELPGHSSAAIAAYPELSCFPKEPTKVHARVVWNGTKEGKQVQQSWGVYEDVFCPTEYTFNFLQDVLDEVVALFPSEYIHIGGDESPKEFWKRSEFAQQLIKEKGLKDEHGLQSYFIQRIEKYLNSKGRKIIGWDEILEGGLAPNATVMSWRGEQGGIDAAKQNHNVIMTPASHVYFDHSQTKNEDSVTIGSYLPVEQVYSYEPIPKELDSIQAKFVLGAQANVWTEYMRSPSKVEYMLFPRISALSEVLWSPKAKKDYNNFQKKLLNEFKRYDLWKANYSKAYLDLQSTVEPTKNSTGVLWKLASKSTGDIFITNKLTNTGIKYTEPVIVNGSGEYEASVVENKNIVSTIKQQFTFNKATGKKITLTSPPSPTYPGKGGAYGLVNGLKAEKGFPSEEWLGWSKNDMHAVIDLGKPENVSKVSIDVWQQERSMIYLPKAVEVSTSTDGSTWSNSVIQNNTNKAWPGNRKIALNYDQPVEARYIKIVAANNGIVPEGKPGAGRDSWLFIDEIEVE